MTRGDEVRSVEVVLDEGPDAPDEADAAADGAAARDRPGRRAARRRSWAAGALLLAVVLVLGVLEARTDRRERGALAASADVPGVVSSLAEPLVEVWHLPVFPPLATAGDVVVTADEPDVVGLDVATGQRRWTLSRPVGSFRPTCPWTVPGGRGGGGADGSARVLCTPFLQVVGRADGRGMDVLDAATGEVTGRVGADALTLALAPVDGDVVVVEAGAAPGLTATRYDTRGGERWSVPADGVELGSAALVVHGDRQVVAIEAPTTVVLDARDGRELGRWVTAADGVGPPRGRVVSHPGAGFGVWQSRFTGRWYAPDGTPGPRLAGEPVEPEVDDGSTPSTVLLGSAGGDRLRAVDVASGDEVWDRPAPGRVLLRLGGNLVVSAGDRLEGWDLVTGEVAWSVALGAGDHPDVGGPYTDGVRLLIPGEDDDGPRLTAYRISDGERVWRAPLPPGSELVTVLGERLAAVGRFDDRVQSAAVLG